MGFESVYKLSVIMQMVDNLSQPMKGLSSKVDSSLSGLDRLSQGFGSITQTGAAMGGLGMQITEGVMQPIEATFATKRAIGELASLGVQDLEMLENAATEFSEKWAGTNKVDFISAAYDIKSGIASLSDEGIAKYTSLAGVTATATKSTIGEMTDLFATGYGIYKNFYGDLSDVQFGEMFSAGISESVKNFKTTGSGMAESIRTLGASATTAQVPLEEQLSILGMLQATMSGSEAGTKYKAFLRSAAKGGAELGLNFMDANNQLLSMPEILEQLRGRFGEIMDAAEKMELQKAFGDTEAVALIDLMYSKTGDLQNNILSLYDSMSSGQGAATQMADAINQTDPARFDILKQKMHNVTEELGNSLNPVIGDYMDKAAGIISKVSDWITNHKELAGQILQVVMALGIFLVSAGTVTSVVGGVGMIFSRTAGLALGFGRTLKNLPGHLETLYIKALYAKDHIKQFGSTVVSVGKTLGTNGVQAVKRFGTQIATMGRQAVTTAATALPGLISGVWSFTAALLANPITWIVIAIVALIAVIILLWNKCEWFRDGVKGVFNFISNGVKNVFNAVRNTFGKIGSALSSGISGAVNAAKSKFSEVKSTINNAMAGAKEAVTQKLNNMKQAYQENGGGIQGIVAAANQGLKDNYTACFNFVDKLTGGKLSAIRDKFTDGIQKIKDKITGAINWFKESGRKIITTFTDGIKSAISAPVEAVKGGLQKIRDMLPFSDAKVGPLNKLTLSGRKVMTTFSTGIRQEEGTPADVVQKSFEGMDFSVAAKAPEIKKDKDSKATTASKDKTVNKRTVIEHLNLTVALEKIDELKKLLQLVEEIEDYTNGNGPDTDPEPQPA